MRYGCSWRTTKEPKLNEPESSFGAESRGDGRGEKTRKLWTSHGHLRPHRDSMGVLPIFEEAPCADASGSDKDRGASSQPGQLQWKSDWEGKGVLLHCQCGASC